MSYILDALKKSEQERSRGSIPDIKTLHQPRNVDVKKSSYWPYVLLVVFLINAGGLGWWIYQQYRQPAASVDMAEARAVDIHDAMPVKPGKTAGGQTDTQAQLARNLAALERESQGTAADSVANPGKGEGQSAAVQTNQPVGANTPQTITKQTTAKQTSAKQTAAKSKPNVIFSNEPLSVSPSELKNAESVADGSALQDVEFMAREHALSAGDENGGLEDKVYDIAELPDHVKRNIPAISFAGHVYSSTQSQRSVMLNGKKMREGQEVSQGLMLEEITIEGVILRSQGYRFKLGALQDWSF